MYVELLTDQSPHKSGDKVEFPEAIAKQLIVTGQAREVQPDGSPLAPAVAMGRSAAGKGQGLAILGDRLLGRPVYTREGWEGAVIGYHEAPTLYLTVEYEGGAIGTVLADGVILGEPDMPYEEGETVRGKGGKPGTTKPTRTATARAPDAGLSKPLPASPSRPGFEENPHAPDQTVAIKQANHPAEQKQAETLSAQQRAERARKKPE